MNDSKKNLIEEIGPEYPTSRKELSVGFLLNFANYIPGPNENDYEDYREYEKAKYAGEQWAFIDKLAKAIVALERKSASLCGCWASFILALMLVADLTSCLPRASIISLSALLSFPSFRYLYSRIIRQLKS